MKINKKVWLTGLLVLGALAVMVTGTAFAQDETPTPEGVAPFGRGRGFAPGYGREVALEAAAEVLGMTPEELSNQLWAGRTLADVAEEAGVDLQTLRDAVEAAQAEAARAAIEAAVENGVLTREHADWLLEGLDNGYWQGFGRGGFHGGFHGGMRGRGGRGFFAPGFEAPATSGDGA
jgi:hypothetical protein